MQWLHVQGNQIVNASGQTVVLRGVNVDHWNWVWDSSPSIAYEQRAIPEATAPSPWGWGANLIVIAVASGPVNRGDATYLGFLDTMVSLAKVNGAYTLLVYRDAEPNDDQPTMPDQAAQDAMAALAARYANEPAVLYGLQVEPNNVTWSQVAPRFLSMIDAIRANNPRSLIVVPGINWGRDITWALKEPLPRTNLIYKTDVYDPWSDIVSDYDLPQVAAAYPVLIGEFGAGTQMSLTDVTQLLGLADTLGLSWSAWLFNSQGCPCLLSNSSTFMPTAYGQVVKDALAQSFG